ncbi:MAG: porin, partial [Burkholderiaceae bacterium]|nr:porin [Burkholderiaceae bacterium]
MWPDVVLRPSDRQSHSGAEKDARTWNLSSGFAQIPATSRGTAWKFWRDTQVAPGIEKLYVEIRMKKSLIALAVAGAFSSAAFAQSTVTLSGIVKGGVQSVKYKDGTGAFAANNGSQLGMADGSSRFIISGSEDLGGGLRGIFQIDTRWR